MIAVTLPLTIAVPLFLALTVAFVCLYLFMNFTTRGRSWTQTIHRFNAAKELEKQREWDAEVPAAGDILGGASPDRHHAGGGADGRSDSEPSGDHHEDALALLRARSGEGTRAAPTSFAVRWLLVLGEGIMCALLALASACGGGACLVLGARQLSRNVMAGPIMIIILGVTLVVLGVVCFISLCRIVTHKAPATATLQRFAAARGCETFPDKGSRLAFALRHSGRLLAETRTRSLVCGLIEEHFGRHPDPESVTTIAEMIRRYHRGTAVLCSLRDQRRLVKRRLRKTNILRKVLAGVFGQAYLFNRISQEENAEIEPLTNKIRSTKESLRSLDQQFAAAVADAIDQRRPSATDGRDV